MSAIQVVHPEYVYNVEFRISHCFTDKFGYSYIMCTVPAYGCAFKFVYFLEKIAVTYTVNGKMHSIVLPSRAVINPDISQFILCTRGNLPPGQFTARFTQKKCLVHFSDRLLTEGAVLAINN